MEKSARILDTDIIGGHEDIPIDGRTRISLSEAMGIVTDEYSKKILMVSSKGPISATGLSNMYNIPLTACYRRIDLLKRVGVLTCTDEIQHQKGKKKKDMFVCTLRKAYIHIEGGKLRIRFELVDGSVKEFGEEHPFSKAQKDESEG